MFVRMHPPETRAEVLRLVAAGVNDCEIARRTGVARTTIRDWRRPRYVPRPRETCLRCWGAMRPMCFTPEDYCELLGLYLGDGYINREPRTYRLRLSLDACYPGIVADACGLLRRCFPGRSVGSVRADGGATTVVSLYANHLPCLLPQHGPGKKHQRRIGTERWQDDLIEVAPWAFLRGLIRSDGCAFVNRTGRYSYRSYDFCNHSQDILDLFSHACGLVGVEHRRTAFRIRVNRRASVALMLQHIGLKA